MPLFNAERLEKERDVFQNTSLSYYIETYGCQMNVRDSESISGIFDYIGFQKAVSKENADIIIFNTCCVRDHAEKRLLGNIGALKKVKDEKPSLIIGICGCMMQQEGVEEKLFSRFPFVNMIFGTNAIHRLPDILAEVMQGKRVCTHEDGITIYEGIPSTRSVGSSAFVNIMYGCNNFCTYCIVPYVRGRERSRKPEDIISEVQDLVRKGYTEITLLGQNVNSYGKEENDLPSFASLLQQIDKIEGLKRIRFMTSHPKDLSDDLIRVMAASDKICHHVHLPLQSGSDRILKLMNRKYDKARYLSIVSKLREQIPDIELTTDIIVGFPGETEEDFSETLNMIDSIGYAGAFTFKYSPRKGTVAADMDNQIPETIKEKRLAEINALQLEKTRQNNEKYVDVSGEVLVEGADEKNPGTVFGKFSNFKMVYFDGSPEDIGKYFSVKVEAVRGNSLRGHKEN